MFDSLVNDMHIGIPNPLNKINLIDVRDVVGSVFQIINHKFRESLPPVINMGGTNLSIKEYCQTVLDCLSLQSKKNLIRSSDSIEIITSFMINTDLAMKYKLTNKYSIENTIKKYVQALQVRESSIVCQ